MEDRVERDRVAAENDLLLAPVDLRDAGGLAREELGGEVAERADQLGLDQLDLAPEVRLARLDLLRQRVAVPGRTAFQNVAYIDILALQPDPVEELGQQLARGADERDALLVLVKARRLADEHQLSGRRAGAEHDLGAPLGERALRAAGDDVAIGDQGEAGRVSSSHRTLRSSRRRSWAARRCRALRTTC